MTPILSGVLAAVACAASLAGSLNVGRARWARLTAALLADVDSAREPAAGARFDPRELDALPAPIARHLRQAIPEGAPIVRAVDVAHRGTFDVGGRGEQWCPFTSRQHIVTRRPGFVWDARIVMPPRLTVHVHDAYVRGEGIVHPALLGLVTLGRVRDRADTARGELMRFLAEAVWYPTALLPSQGVRWEPVDDDRARATLADGPLSVSLAFHVGPDGLVDTVTADARGRTVGREVVPTRWEARVGDYERRDGWLVPTQGEVAWLAPEGRRPYWRGRIVEILHRA